MTWVRLDDNFARHPKVLKAGPLGIALHVAALCYCNQHMTDGWVPTPAASTLLDFSGLGMRMWEGDVMGGGEDADWRLVVDDLVEAGLWEPVDDGWQIHDYLDYQPSKAHLDSVREVRQRAGKKGGKGAKQTLSKPPSKTEAKAKPVPVPVPEEESAATTESTAARDVDEQAEQAAAALEDDQVVEPNSETETEPIDSSETPSEPKPPDRGVAVIAAFDAERARVFGAAQARPFPNSTDLGEAKAMLDAGADPDTCRFVFRSVFERQKASGKQPAGALRYMRRPVTEALADPFEIPVSLDRRHGTRYRPRNEVLDEQRAESYRRAVSDGRTPYWQDNWGDPPAVDGSMEARDDRARA